MSGSKCGDLKIISKVEKSLTEFREDGHAIEEVNNFHGHTKVSPDISSCMSARLPSVNCVSTTQPPARTLSQLYALQHLLRRHQCCVSVPGYGQAVVIHAHYLSSIQEEHSRDSPLNAEKL